MILPDSTFLSLLAQVQQTPGLLDTHDITLLYWAGGLLLLAALLGALELVVPSGLLTLGAGVCILVAIGFAFRYSIAAGGATTLAVVVAVPALAWIAFKVFPSTPIGREFILTEGRTEEENARQSHDKSMEARAIHALVGARGKAMTVLRPGGTIRIEGEDIEAFAETGMIEQGSTVEVTAVSGRLIRVIKVDPASAPRG